MIAGAVLGLVLTAHLVLASDSNCPSSRDIDSNLAVLLPGDAAWPGTASVTAAPDGLLVDLRPEHPAVSAQRSVAVGENCDERARAVAVVIATWWPMGPNVKTPSETTTEIAAVAPAERQFALSVGGFASVITDGVAPGARAEASWVSRGKAFGVRLSLDGTAAQGGSLGSGQVHWRRASAQAGPSYALGPLRADVGAAVSMFWIEGSGYATNQTSSGAAVGATAGLRAGWTWGRLLPWLEARGILWPQSQSIYVTDTATNNQIRRAIPRGELQLGAGIALSLF